MANSIANDFKYVQALTGHSGCINALAISRNVGRFLATGSDDKQIILHDLFSKNFDYQPISLNGHENNVFSLKFGKRDNYLYSCGLDGFSFVYDLNKSNHPFFEGGNASEQAYKIDVKKDDDNLFAVASTHALELFDLRVRGPFSELTLRQHLSTVNFHPTQQKILIASMKGKLDLLDERRPERPLLTYNTALTNYPSFFFQRNFGTTGMMERFRISETANIHFELPISNASFNYNGELILAAPLFFFPALYKTSNIHPEAIFYAKELRHVWTMKNFNFGGPDDKMILAGSDKKLGFFWHLPEMYHTKFMHNRSSEYSKNALISKQKKYSNPLTYNRHREQDRILSRPFYEKINDSVDYFSNSSYARIHFKGAENPFSVCQTHGKLYNAKGMINSIVMHKKMPLIFTAGVENVVHVYSNLELGHKSKQYDQNSETLNIFEHLLTQNTLEDIF